MSLPLLDLKNVTIKFGGLTAVSDLSISIGEGELVGLIGPNGAGKTTAFNMITGVYQPTSGEISFAGKNTLGVFDEIDDVIFLTADIRSTNNTHGFVERDVDMFFTGGFNGLAIDAHIVAFLHLRSHFGHLAVDGDTALLDEDIRRTARAKAYFTEVFIDAGFHGREGRSFE